MRDLLQRRYVDQVAVKQLAVELAHTETWVSVTLHRARAFLRDCLQRGGNADAAGAVFSADAANSVDAARAKVVRP